ncbi:hypothetical protein CASFOL_031002 [Castilleja foliolosa]|uniref:F-box associated domain-containing protein n=1 Tax=Castilleja foliolosa TaxID=1961234 RepID=A0ABD3C7P2_9LAMI
MDNIPPSFIRQPSPPLITAARKEGKTNPEIVGGNNLKRKSLTDIESLPDEVLFEVLVRYAAASREYKAVVIFTPREGMKKMCCIFTIGVDSFWRTIGEETVSLAATHLFTDTPLITEGFVHWYHIYSNKVLTLNVETEIFTETSGPTPKVNWRNSYLSTGRYLTLLRPCGLFCWEVWEMKPKIDYRWRKVLDISLEDHKCSTFKGFGSKQPEGLISIGWLKYREILVFGIMSQSIQSQVFVYNLLTHEIVIIELPVPYSRYELVVHKDNLVSLGGC